VWWFPLPEIVLVGHGGRGHGLLGVLIVSSLEGPQDGIQAVDPSEAIALEGHHAFPCNQQSARRGREREGDSLKMKKEPKTLTMTMMTP
jgi:hypothetical protein